MHQLLSDTFLHWIILWLMWHTQVPHQWTTIQQPAGNLLLLYFARSKKKQKYIKISYRTRPVTDGSRPERHTPVTMVGMIFHCRLWTPMVSKAPSKVPCLNPGDHGQPWRPCWLWPDFRLTFCFIVPVFNGLIIYHSFPDITHKKVNSGHKSAILNLMEVTFFIA